MTISFKHLNVLLAIFCFCLVGNSQTNSTKVKPRVLISTDIGGTDPDDFQSLIHLLMYANEISIEGLISSPYGPGRKTDFLPILELYEKDLPKLKKHAKDFPDAQSLRNICKQGEVQIAPYKGYRKSTEGSDWIVSRALKQSDQPLWILVWGGLEDLAQALHDAPQIKSNIKVYWIGGPNKKWSVNAYAYIAENHPDLWMIEANATYRGWFLDAGSPKNITSSNYYNHFIKNKGHLGKDFVNYYNGVLKMGDTPSLAYILNGEPNNPLGESWGGSFTKIDRSTRTIFHERSEENEPVAAYDVLEWRFKGPENEISKDSVCFTMTIADQIWDGYYLGNGDYGIRYSSKKPEKGSYVTSSPIPSLDGLRGHYTSTTPWPGTPSETDYLLGENWYADRTEEEFFIGVQQGANTVAKHRKAFLMDWAKRWKWLE